MLPKVIDYNKFVSRGELLSGTLARDVFMRNKGVFSLVSDVSVALYFEKNGNNEVTLNTDVSALVSTDCQRCLELLEFEISKSGEFSIYENDSENARNLADNDGKDIFCANDGKLNILELVEDELLLAAPMIPKHENMSSCGTMNHNTGNKGKSNVRKPFAGLRELMDISEKN